MNFETIDFDDKIETIERPNLLDTEQIRAVDINEIKRVVNNNANEADITFIYKCIGVNDDLAIQNIVNNFFNSETAMTMKLIVSGIMGLQTSPISNIHINLNSLNTRGAICFIDFEACNIPNVTVADRDFINIAGSIKTVIDGLNVKTTRYSIYALGTSSNIFNNCTVSGSFATYLTATSKNILNNCIITGGVAVYCTSTALNVLNNCTITGTAYGATYITGVGILNNCTINGVSYAVSIIGKGIVSNCIINGGSTGLLQTSQAAVATINNCTINAGNFIGIVVANTFSGTLNVSNSQIISSTTGISVATANTSARIILSNNRIRGTVQDIQQASGANTIKWNLMGNSFGKANIIINGTEGITSAISSEYIFMPEYANLFDQTIN